MYNQVRIMEDELPIDTDVLCIDGTKYEANAKQEHIHMEKKYCQT